MKKVLAMLFVLMIAFSLVACGGEVVETGDEWAYGDYMTEEQYAKLSDFYNEWAPVAETILSYADNENVQSSENGPAVIAKVQDYDIAITGLLSDPSLIAESGEDFDTFLGNFQTILDSLVSTALPAFEEIAG